MDPLDITRLILDYQHAVRRLVAALRSLSGCEDLLTARHSGRLAKDGTIGGIEYSFHGVGCYGSVDGVEVDFDFGPSCRHDGFDAWRLWDFARQFPNVYPQFQNEKAVDKALSDLARRGTIECPRLEPSPHLWYLVPGAHLN